MNKDVLRKTMLFREMTDEEITSALSHLSASEKYYQKGEIILHSGSFTDKMGLVLDGSVSIENNDIWGNRTILSNISKGQFFAETGSEAASGCNKILLRREDFYGGKKPLRLAADDNFTIPSIPYNC